MTMWGNTDESTTQLTEADLLRAYEAVRNEEWYPHGHEKNPHIVHPRNPSFCIECGMRRD